MKQTPTPIGAHPRLCLLLLAAGALVLSGCWNTNYSRDRWGFKPPSRPRGETQPSTPDWIPPGLDTKDSTKTSVEDADYHLSILPGPVAISIRKNPPQSKLVMDRATVRIDLRVGYRHGLLGLAELATIGVLELPDGPRNQPDLRTLIARLGGSIEAEVGADWTRFTATVPSANWQSALRAITDRLRRSSLTQRQFNAIQDRLIRRYLLGWTRNPLLSQMSQWVRHDDLGLDALIQAIQDRNLPEISLFHQRHYQPRGVAIGLWVPNSPKDPKLLFAQALASVKAWQPGPIPPAGLANSDPPPPKGVRWSEGPGKESEIALIIPMSPRTPESMTLLECLSMSGIGGRLGMQLKERLGQEPVLEHREVGNYNQRYTLLIATVPADQVPAVWRAAQAAWESLASKPPIGEELLASARRARLRLLRRQDHPDSWFEAMGLGLMRRQTGGPVRDLASVDKITMQTAASAARKLVAGSIAMVVTGGSIPKNAGPEFQKIFSKVPDYNPATKTETPEASAKTRQFLNLAVQALGDRRQFAAFKGYRSVETWKDQEGLTARAETRYRSDGQMSRQLRVLNTSINTSVLRAKQGVKGEESVGKTLRKLSAGEATNLLDEAASHPIALIARFVLGKTRFHYLGMRTFEGRRVALLERVDAAQPRLRITIDARTGLLRTVETTLHRSGVGLVQVRESYDDYRRINGLRVPMHRVSSADGRQTSDCTCQEFNFLR